MAWTMLFFLTFLAKLCALSLSSSTHTVASSLWRYSEAAAREAAARPSEIAGNETSGDPTASATSETARASEAAARKASVGQSEAAINHQPPRRLILTNDLGEEITHQIAYV